MSNLKDKKDSYVLTSEAYSALYDVMLGNLATQLSLEWMANDPDG
jgi:hypothetical protein